MAAKSFLVPTLLIGFLVVLLPLLVFDATLLLHPNTAPPAFFNTATNLVTFPVLATVFVWSSLLSAAASPIAFAGPTRCRNEPRIPKPGIASVSFDYTH